MSFSDYAELQKTIGRYAWRTGVEGETQDDAFMAEVPTFIRLCESRVNRELRVSDMLKRGSISVFEGEGRLPSDYLQLRRVWETAHPNVDLLPGEERSGRGYVLSGRVFRGWPATMAGVGIDYFARIPALSDDNPTNWLLERAPEVYLYGSLLEAMPFEQSDQRAGTWHAYYDKAMEGLRVADTMAVYARSGWRPYGVTP